MKTFCHFLFEGSLRNHLTEKAVPNTKWYIYMTGFQLFFYPTNRTRVQLTIERIKEFLHPSCREPTTDKIDIACNVNDVPTRQKDSINILNFPLLKR